MSNKPTIDKLVVDHFQMIYDSTKHVAKEYEVKRVPIGFIYIIIDKATMPEKSEDKTVKKWSIQINKTLKTLKKAIKTQSKQIGDGCLSLNELKKMIDLMKIEFLSAYNKVENKD